MGTTKDLNIGGETSRGLAAWIFRAKSTGPWHTPKSQVGEIWSRSICLGKF